MNKHYRFILLATKWKQLISPSTREWKYNFLSLYYGILLTNKTNKQINYQNTKKDEFQ